VVDERNDILAGIEELRTHDVVDIVRATSQAAGIDAAVSLLADVQREVGLRWQTQHWTVAEEHAATAIVDIALTAAALETTPPAGEAVAVLVCGEGEWHGLPARMAAEQLRAAGCEVLFLGTSVPADHVKAYLRKSRVTAVLVSCTVPIHLGGTRRTVAAAHAAGVPAIVGGAAFDRAGRRAAAIGADAYAAATGDAALLLREWVRQPPQLADATVSDAAALALAATRPTVVAAAMELLAQRFPPFAAYTDDQRDSTREDFDYILQFVEAALLTDDPTVVAEFVQWLSRLLTARDLPASIVPLSLDVLHDCVSPDAAGARRLLSRSHTPSIPNQYRQGGRVGRTPRRH
jgi:methanogenic corrinoid protein MtbC1